MTFQLPRLPYSRDALAPHISQETLAYHYGKHHAAYIEKLNELVEKDRSLAGKSLEDLIMLQKGPVFDQAAQAYNHDFYWHSMRPDGGGEPRGRIANAIERSFGSFSDFKEKFTEVAVHHFASGWAWLVKEPNGRLAVCDTHDAGNPLCFEQKPILTCDLWEHAYYIDYKNDRARYIEGWWELLNWEFAEKNLV
jgi:Fe-Mn family superoxide dismutase